MLQHAPDSQPTSEARPEPLVRRPAAQRAAAASLPHVAHLPLPLRIVAWSGPLLWLFSIVDALIRSRGTPDFDGFHWIFYSPAAFDFYNYADRVAFLRHPAFFTHAGYPWYYPAPCILVLLPLYRVGHLLAPGTWLAGYLLYFSLALAGFFAAALQVRSALHRRGISLRSATVLACSIGMFSWPLYFALQRGNIEALTWLLLAAAFWAFARQRWLLTAVLLGVAAAFKLYPLLCLALFLPARRWRELLLCLLTFALVTLLALYTLSPSLSFSFHGTINAIHRWISDYAVTYSHASAPFDHSFYELTKVLTLPWHPAYPSLLHRYLLTLLVVAVVLFLVRIRLLPRSNQVLFLVVACSSFPPASMDYTLLNLYIPFAWLSLAVVPCPQLFHRPSIYLTFLLFGLSFGPKTFLSLHHISQQGLATSIALLGLLLVSLVVPLPDLQPCPHLQTSEG